MRRIAAVLIVALSLAGCASNKQAKTLTVFAAASLRDAFRAIASSFERAHPGVTVKLSFGPSSGLAAQIEEGAEADVFAAAGTDEIDRVARSVGITERAMFARNRLVVIVPSSNTAHVRSVADLARGGVKLVIAAAAVPAGRYARAVLTRAGIERSALRNVVSNEPDVKGVLQKVMSGDADAGIAYATDVTPSVEKKLSRIDIPQRLQVPATYPIATLLSGHQGSLARAFLQEVLGEGQRTLRALGFLPP